MSFYFLCPFIYFRLWEYPGGLEVGPVDAPRLCGPYTHLPRQKPAKNSSASQGFHCEGRRHKCRRRAAPGQRRRTHGVRRRFPDGAARSEERSPAPQHHSPPAAGQPPSPLVAVEPVSALLCFCSIRRIKSFPSL
jgi:hypothetical protein